MIADLERWQFRDHVGHVDLLRSLTLELAPLVATMQTIRHRNHDDSWLRLKRFFGLLPRIGFAIGVATGLVEEFQFGMNWSVYSNLVGGVSQLSPQPCV